MINFILKCFWTQPKPQPMFAVNNLNPEQTIVKWMTKWSPVYFFLRISVGLSARCRYPVEPRIRNIYLFNNNWTNMILGQLSLARRLLHGGDTFLLFHPSTIFVKATMNVLKLYSRYRSTNHFNVRRLCFLSPLPWNVHNLWMTKNLYQIICIWCIEKKNDQMITLCTQQSIDDMELG
jgi:hypothetical protein